MRFPLFYFFLSFFLVIFSFQTAYCEPYDSASNREAVATQRVKKFFKSNSSKEYLSLGGIYSSDYNSKKYQFNSRYLYQSNYAIHEANFEHETEYSDQGSGSKKQYYVKSTELYDLTLASKLKIGESRNYGVFFHRTIHDRFSDYYNDSRTALGLGRMFFNEKIEFDVSLGYQDVKNYGYKAEVISSIRSNIKLTERLTFQQRGFIFLDNESMDNSLRTSLVYRIGDRLSFEIRNNFDQRRYENKNSTTNRVSRSITLGLIFDLN